MHIEKQLKILFSTRSGFWGDFAAAEKTAKEKKQNIGDVLVSNGAINENDLRRIKASVLSIPFVDLKGEHIDFDVLFPYS